jgi:membrane fusion protein (multidrug efflux system)
MANCFSYSISDSFKTSIMKKFIRIVVSLLFIGAAIGVVVWKLNDNKKVIEEQAKLAQERNDVIPVKTAVLSRQSVSSKFKSSGQFQPFKELALISDVSGRITQLNVKNGSLVNEGSVVLTVDNDLLKNQLDITALNLKKAENDLSRLKNLVGDGGITQQQVYDAEIAVENLKAQIRGLEKQISLTVIKAPIAGIVSGKTVEKGAFIGPGAPILNIVQVARLKFQANLSEEEVVQIKTGQQVTLSADLYPDKNFTGVVTYISAKADNARRFMVEVELDNNAANPLKGGMNGYANFDSGKSATLLALPREAIVGSVRDAKVFVVENGVAQLKPVRLGVIYGDFVAVLDGLREGDIVVVAGQINLEDGTKVDVSSK